MSSRATPPSPAEEEGRLGRTRRERLRELLLASEDGVPLDALEKILEAPRSIVINDLEHLRLSFKHQQATLHMVPPSCSTCGYVFRLEHPKAPSKCPNCKSRDLNLPVFKATAEA